MKITGQYVGFGDCFTVDEPKRNETLLVDFGSDTPCVLRKAEKDILNCCEGRRFSVVLTHFHQDHINGFWETDLPQKIDIQTVYLPDILAMRRTETQFDFLQVQLLYDLFSAVVLNRKPVEITLYSLLERLTKNRAKVVFSQCGSSFQFAGQEFQILWPNFSVLKLDSRFERSLSDLLLRLELLDGDESLDRDEKKRAHIWYVDDIINLLLEGYSALHRGEAEAARGRFNRIEESLLPILERFSDWGEHLSRDVLDAIKQRMATLKNQGNRISLVFQDTPQGGRSRLLMTGDATAADLKRIIAGNGKNLGGPSLAEEYTAIKAPHHGTNSHFVPDFPACGHILISNGTPSPQHRNWGKISYLYRGFYASHRGCQIHCTSNRCQTWEKRGMKPCSSCPGSCVTVDLP